MRGKKNPERQQPTRSKSKESVHSPLQFPFAEMPERGITRETCEYFGVRMSVDPMTGEKASYYFPYHDQRGNLTGWKVRDLTKDKNDDFYFTTIGKVGVDCQLFGQPQAARNNVKTLYIQEGEIDCMAAWQAMRDGVKNHPKWGNLIPAVVSIQCGTANAVEGILHNEKWVKGHATLVLGFDNDEATEKEYKRGIRRGKEATEEVAAALMMDNLYVIKYDEGMKDACNYLEEGRWKDLNKLLLGKGEKYVAEKIVHAKQYTLDQIFQPKPKGVYIPAFPNLSERLRGFRKKEMSIVTALSGIGKSSVVAEVAYELAQSGNKVGMIFLEEEDRETIQRLSARYLGINYNRFKFNPRKYATEEQLQQALDWVDEHFVFLDHFGSLRINVLLNKMKSMVYLEKTDFIIVDHLSMVVSGMASKDERKDIDIAMTELAAFTNVNDVGTIVVSHLNRDGADDIRNMKVRDEPIWVRVRKEDLRGSAAIEQLAWIVVGVEAEIMPDRTRGRVRVTLLKNRPTGWLGECDTVKMDERTGLFRNASDESLFTSIAENNNEGE